MSKQIKHLRKLTSNYIAILVDELNHSMERSTQLPVPFVVLFINLF